VYHPQTDGQTERMNQEVEQYLCLFINHRQTDWSQWLSCAEFSYNDKMQTSTGFSPFFVNYGRHPYKGTNPKKEVKSQSATEFAQDLHAIWDEAAASLRLANEQMKRFYDKHRGDARKYQPNDQVWLEGYNFTTDRPSKKLSDKRYGPFKIISKVGAAAYKLQLPRTWKHVWPVFNELLLTPYTPPHYEIQRQPPPPPPVLADEGHLEYEVLEIMDSKLYRGRLRYLVQWKGYPERHEWTWEPTSNLSNAQDAIRDFHKTHPAAPRPAQLKEFTFIPYQNHTTGDHPPTTWTDGIIEPDAWNEIRSRIINTLIH
jgi:hypothetical protein